MYKSLIAFFKTIKAISACTSCKRILTTEVKKNHNILYIERDFIKRIDFCKITGSSV